MTRYAMWGTKKGAEDWQEDLLLSDATAEQVERVKVLAAKDGFHKFRAVPLDDLRPDFAATAR